jgi:hypothetical protein
MPPSLGKSLIDLGQLEKRSTPTKVEHFPRAQTDSVKEGRRLITRTGGLLNETETPLSSATEILSAKTTKEKLIKNKATPLAK